MGVNVNKSTTEDEARRDRGGSFVVPGEDDESPRENPFARETRMGNERTAADAKRRCDRRRPERPSVGR
ncbi:MAG: hypothetical protein D6723_14065 [Acidobacteria bacterium]|nr:MAG: hypothetical protein D6723_14065 [Acidobacteriota bacterium]